MSEVGRGSFCVYVNNVSAGAELIKSLVSLTSRWGGAEAQSIKARWAPIDLMIPFFVSPIICFP